MLLCFFEFLQLLLTLLTWIIIIQAILSWLVAFNVINTYNDFVRSLLNALDRITEPLYRPIRRILPDFGGIDFSPLVVLLLIYVIRILLSGVAADVAYCDDDDRRHHRLQSLCQIGRDSCRERGGQNV